MCGLTLANASLAASAARHTAVPRQEPTCPAVHSRAGGLAPLLQHPTPTPLPALRQLRLALTLANASLAASAARHYGTPSLHGRYTTHERLASSAWYAGQGIWGEAMPRLSRRLNPVLDRAEGQGYTPCLCRPTLPRVRWGMAGTLCRLLSHPFSASSYSAQAGQGGG